MKKSHIRNDIQGLRAIAVLLVALYHFELLTSGGFIGVDVFFVISGYVIISMLMREAAANGGRINLQRFYVRRALRLLPASALMSVVSLAATAILFTPITDIQRKIATTGVGSSFWMANFFLYWSSGDYFDAAAAANPLTHMWSLAVEEQFYFVIPALLVGVWAIVVSRWRRRNRCANQQMGTAETAPIGADGNGQRPGFIKATAFLLAAVLIFSLAIEVWFTYDSDDYGSLMYYASFTRAWEFCVGALVACLPAWPSAYATAAKTMQAVGVAGIVASAFMIDSTMVFPGWVAIFPVASTAAAIYFGSLTSSLWLLRNPLSKHIGDISYSLYLWHWPIWVFGSHFFTMSVGAKLAAMLLSYLAALASYHLVENRFRHIGNRFNRRTVPFIAAAILIPLLVSSGLAAASSHSWFSSRVRDLHAQATDWWTCGTGYNATSKICVYPIGVTVPPGAADVKKNPVPHIVLPADARIADNPAVDLKRILGPNSNPIYIYGDSNAEMYVPLMRTIAEKLNRPLVAVTMHSKPATLADRSYGATYAAIIKAKTSWLAKQPKGTVVMTSASYGTDMTRGVLGGLPPGFRIHDKKVAAALKSLPPSQRTYVAGTAFFYEKLQQSGHRVKVIETLPPLQGLAPLTTCSLGYILSGKVNECASTLPLAESLDRIKQWDRLIALATQEANIPLIKVRHDVCPNGVCASIRNGVIIYRDRSHLTTAYASTLTQLGDRLFADAKPR